MAHRDMGDHGSFFTAHSAFDQDTGLWKVWLVETANDWAYGEQWDRIGTFCDEEQADMYAAWFVATHHPEDFAAKQEGPYPYEWEPA